MQRTAGVVADPTAKRQKTTHPGSVNLRILTEDLGSEDDISQGAAAVASLLGDPLSPSSGGENDRPSTDGGDGGGAPPSDGVIMISQKSTSEGGFEVEVEPINIAQFICSRPHGLVVPDDDDDDDDEESAPGGGALGAYGGSPAGGPAGQDTSAGGGPGDDPPSDVFIVTTPIDIAHFDIGPLPHGLVFSNEEESTLGGGSLGGSVGGADPEDAGVGPGEAGLVPEDPSDDVALVPEDDAAPGVAPEAPSLSPDAAATLIKRNFGIWYRRRYGDHWLDVLRYLVAHDAAPPDDPSVEPEVQQPNQDTLDNDQVPTDGTIGGADPEDTGGGPGVGIHADDALPAEDDDEEMAEEPHEQPDSAGSCDGSRGAGDDEDADAGVLSEVPSNRPAGRRPRGGTAMAARAAAGLSIQYSDDEEEEVQQPVGLGDVMAEVQPPNQPVPEVQQAGPPDDPGVEEQPSAEDANQQPDAAADAEMADAEEDQGPEPIAGGFGKLCWFFFLMAHLFNFLVCSGYVTSAKHLYYPTYVTLSSAFPPLRPKMKMVECCLLHLLSAALILEYPGLYSKATWRMAARKHRTGCLPWKRTVKSSLFLMQSWSAFLLPTPCLDWRITIASFILAGPTTMLPGMIGALITLH